MAIVSFDTLTPEVLSAAPGCPIPTIVRNFRHAARELCEKSSCYRYRIAQTAVTANASETAISVPTQTVMHRPISFTLNGYELHPTSSQMLDEDDKEWRTRTGQPIRYLRSTTASNSIFLVPTPDTSLSGSSGLVGEIALKPTISATGIDDLFLEKYYNVLVQGVLASILNVRSAPFYDPRAAQDARALFYSMIDDAAAEGNGDDLPKRRTVRYGGYDGVNRVTTRQRYV